MKFNDPVYTLPQITQKQIEILAKQNIFTIIDLLNYFPRTYLDTRYVVPLHKWTLDDGATTLVKVTGNRMMRTRGGKYIVITTFVDEEGNNAECMWFNQPFMLKAMEVSQYYLVYGKLSKNSGRKISIQVVEYERLYDARSARHLGAITSIYREPKGMSSKFLRNKINYILSNLTEMFTENLPDEFIKHFKLVSIDKAYKNIHIPESVDDLDEAKRRFAHDEIYQLHTKLKGIENERYKIKGIKIEPKILNKNLTVNSFVNNVGDFLNIKFSLTKGQVSTSKEILEDISQLKPSNRLLQGDVGSGKTVVTAIAARYNSLAGFDSVILCPTTVLAKQHFESFQKFFEGFDVDIVQVTANIKLDQLNNKPTIFIGTHAILFKKPEIFKNVTLLVVDEQHRFGVVQREQLVFEIRQFNSNKFTPHLLIVTATPIPRSVAQISLSDLQVSYIESVPTNRKPIKTFLINEDKRESCYEWIRSLIKNGDQAYVICPLVEDSKLRDMKNVKAEYENISKIFPEFSVGLLHGKILDSGKNKVLDDFKAKKYDILVSTQVIEVGVDVPNSTVIIIESAERFGLAQLHQLRGRVGRGDKQSYCVLFTTPGFINETNQSVLEKLDYFCNTTNGMLLSEYDMQQRGFGNVIGTEQSGFMKFKFVNLNDLELIKHVRDVLNKLNL